MSSQLEDNRRDLIIIELNKVTLQDTLDANLTIDEVQQIYNRHRLPLGNLEVLAAKLDLKIPKSEEYMIYLLGK